MNRQKSAVTVRSTPFEYDLTNDLPTNFLVQASELFVQVAPFETGVAQVSLPLVGELVEN